MLILIIFYLMTVYYTVLAALQIFLPFLSPPHHSRQPSWVKKNLGKRMLSVLFSGSKSFVSLGKS